MSIFCGYFTDESEEIPPLNLIISITYKTGIVLEIAKQNDLSRFTYYKGCTLEHWKWLLAVNGINKNLDLSSLGDIIPERKNVSEF